jgi:ubiquinone/menaquinone biosynthesis C-methylase UbiE
VPDAAFDAGIASLVLCSVPDQSNALAELRRVIRAGGELRFFEHVVSKRAGPARVQRIADRTIRPFVTGGCHVARDTLAAIEAAGFVIERSERFSFSGWGSGDPPGGGGNVVGRPRCRRRPLLVPEARALA